MILDRIVNGVRWARDFYQTSPFGETVALVSSAMLLLNYDNPKAVIADLFAISVGVFLTASQFYQRRRLEQEIEQNGFNEELFANAKRTFCDNNTAKVVARKYGFLDEYKTLG